MDFTKIQESVNEVGRESQAVVQIIRTLRKLGILYPCPDDVARYMTSSEYDDCIGWLGFVKTRCYESKKGKRWEKTFVPVVKINSDDTVAWHHEIAHPDKVLQKLIEKYREKNSKVVEVSKVHPFLLEEAKEEKKEITKPPMIIGGFHVEIEGVEGVNSHVDESSA